VAEAGQGATDIAGAEAERVQAIAMAAVRQAIKGADGALRVVESSKYYSIAAATATAAGLATWGAVPAVFSMTSDALAVAAASAAGVAVQLWSLVKLEVLRDVQQTLSLLFSAIASSAIESSKAFFGNVSNLVALDLNFVIPAIPPSAMYAIFGVLGLALFLCFLVVSCVAGCYQPDEIREGAEAKTWDKLGKEKPWLPATIKYTIIAALSLYLPVARSVVQILACDASMAQSMYSLGLTQGNKICTRAGPDTYRCDCSKWPSYGGFQALAWALIFGFVIFLPVYCVILIRRNIPVGSRDDPNKRYDDEGNLVAYTDAQYLEDLRTDPRQTTNPFLFLYSDYERNSSYYKYVRVRRGGGGWGYG
jgi:hypothetical protein